MRGATLQKSSLFPSVFKAYSMRSVYYYGKQTILQAYEVL